MKRLLSIVLVAMLLLWAIPASAQTRYSTQQSQPLTSSGMFVDADGNDMDTGVWIYGINIFADENSSFMGVYDTDAADLTTGGLYNSSTQPDDEIGEATAYDTQIREYDPPRYFENGIGGIITTGVGFVRYGPDPR